MKKILLTFLIILSLCSFADNSLRLISSSYHQFSPQQIEEFGYTYHGEYTETYSFLDDHFSISDFVNWYDGNHKYATIKFDSSTQDCQYSVPNVDTICYIDIDLISKKLILKYLDNE